MNTGLIKFTQLLKNDIQGVNTFYQCDFFFSFYFSVSTCLQYMIIHLVETGTCDLCSVPLFYCGQQLECSCVHCLK